MKLKQNIFETFCFSFISIVADSFRQRKSR